MRTLTDNLESIANRIRENFSAQDAAREKALPLCRDAIRHSSNAIRAVHRQEFKEAKKLLQNARRLITRAEQTIAGGELSNIGFIRDAQKEFAEGSITLALATRKQPPNPEELKVSHAAYLNGLGEAAGEMRRYLLDSLRRDDLSRCEEILSAMDDIYSVLVTMDFPDAITGGLRHTTDMVRGVLERTRSDLTLVMRQKELEEKLARKMGGNFS
jgi:translin